MITSPQKNKSVARRWYNAVTRKLDSGPKAHWGKGLLVNCFAWNVLFVTSSVPAKKGVGCVDCHFAIPGKELVIFLQAYRYRMWSQTFLMHLDAMITDDTVLDGRSVIYTHRTNPQKKRQKLPAAEPFLAAKNAPVPRDFDGWPRQQPILAKPVARPVARFDIHGWWWYPLINFRAIGKPRRGALAYGVSDRPSSLSLQCHCWAFWACAFRTSEQAKRCQKFGLAGGFKLSIIYNPSFPLTFIFIKMVKTTNKWLFLICGICMQLLPMAYTPSKEKTQWLCLTATWTDSIWSSTKPGFRWGGISSSSSDLSRAVRKPMPDCCLCWENLQFFWNAKSK